MNYLDRILARASAALTLSALLATASAQIAITPEFTADYSFTDLGSAAGVPPNYGGLTFKAGDPDTLLIGGGANGGNAKVYSIGVVRDAGGHITGFTGSATLVAPAIVTFSGGIDGGLAYGPDGVLFFTTYPDNRIGQIKPGSAVVDKGIDANALGIYSSLGTLNFVPPGFGGAGRLKILSYSGSRWYDAEVASDGAGTFDIVNVGPAIDIFPAGNGPEGVIYVPQASPHFPQPSILISSFGTGKIVTFEVDANGDPLTATPRDFMTGLSGTEGATIDPVTKDFLFSTYGGGNKVIVVRGFAALPFHDAFTGAPSPSWGNEVGNWTVVNDTYDAQAPANNPATYSGLPFVIGDGTVLVDIQHLQDGGVWLHSTDNQNGVLLITGGHLGAGTGLYWHTVTGGSYSPNLSEVGGLFTPGVSNAHLRIEIKGDTYSVYVNGSSIPASTLTTNAFPTGRVGLYDFSNQTFDNVTVTEQFAPSVTTIMPSGSVFNGTANPNGLDTLGYFEYGADTTYGSMTPHQMLGNGTSGMPFSFDVGVLAPHGVLHYRAVAVNGVDLVHGEDETITVPNSPPIAVHDHLDSNGAPNSLDPTVNDTDDDLDTLTVTDYSQGTFGTVSQVDNTLTYTPGPDYEGHDSFTYTIDDGFGGTAVGTVTVHATLPITRVLYTGAKDGTGTETPGEGGATFVKFGIPSINASGRVAFTSNFKLTKGDAGVFDGTAIVAGKGDAAPDLSGLTLNSFKDPALADDGSVAFLASLKGAPSSDTNQGLFTNRGGTFHLAQQKGAAAPGVPGATIKAIKSFVLTSTAVWYVASMEGTVTTADDTGLWYWTPGGGAQLKLREGQPLNGGTVKSFVALKPASGSPGQGRSAHGDVVLVKVTYSTGAQANVLVTSVGNSFFEGTNSPAPDITGGLLNKLGIPIHSSNGGRAFLASLTGVPSTANKAVFAFVGAELHRIIGKGDMVSGQSLKAFKDPVYNALDDVAAISTLVATADKTAIVYAPAGSSPSIVARLGDHPAGTPAGVKWKAFKSVALPDGLGPVFVGSLLFSPGLVDATSDVGLWALDGNGSLDLLVREGDPIGGKTVKLFTVIKSVSGSADQTRSFNSQHQIIYRATFTDGTSAIVRVTVP